MSTLTRPADKTAPAAPEGWQERAAEARAACGYWPTWDEWASRTPVADLLAAHTDAACAAILSSSLPCA